MIKHLNVIIELYNITGEINSEFSQFKFSHEFARYIKKLIKKYKKCDRNIYNILLLWLAVLFEYIWYSRGELFGFKNIHKIVKIILQINKYFENIKLNYNIISISYHNNKMNNIYKIIEQTYKFPKLYKIRTIGGRQKIRVWHIYSISTDDEENIGYWSVRFGWKDGEKTNDRKIAYSKNIGKKNETTPYQQAFKDAMSAFKLKIKNGYRSSIANARTQFNQPVPMLALKWKTAKNKPKFPLIGQPKLDGTRCLASKEGDKIILKTRSGNIIPHFPIIKDELSKILTSNNIVFDGELYTKKLPLRTITGIVNPNRTRSDKNEKLIKYFIFDLINLDRPNMKFINRHKLLKKMYNTTVPKKNLRIVNNIKLPSEDTIDKWINKWRHKFEGLIIRDPNGIYEFGKRSKGLYKYKPRNYDKAIITDIVKIPETELRTGIVIHVKHPITHVEYIINGIGTSEYQMKVFNDKKNYIGKLIEYSYTSKTDNMVPREATIKMDNDEYTIETIV